STPTPASFTGDRTVFIGRNRSLRDPAAVEHVRLTGNTGAGLDPCAAVQIAVEIEPGDTAEMTFLLGQADDEEQARAIVTRFRDPANVEAAFQETRRRWDRLLSTIEVETPGLSTNFLLNVCCTRPSDPPPHNPPPPPPGGAPPPIRGRRCPALVASRFRRWGAHPDQ